MKKKEIVTLRLDRENIDNLQIIAEGRHLPMRTMIRAWILDRIDIELKGVNDAEEIQ